jgi:hypothetical protein
MGGDGKLIGRRERMERILYKLRGLKPSIGALDFCRRPGIVCLFWPLVLEDITYMYVLMYTCILVAGLEGDMAYVCVILCT